MKEPIERLIGKTQYNPATGMIRVEVPYSDYATLIRRGYSRAEIILLDDRHLSDKQRKACYAMIGEIADYIGDEKSEVKEFLKLEFMTSELEETGDRLFSMSNAPMSLIASFQRFLARFIVRHDIPTKRSMLDYIDDIQDYVYACCYNKKCCICGEHSDLHHVDAIGMGNDRDEVVHEGRRALPLCRTHHSELHTMGNTAFMEKWHIEPIIVDRALCKVYRIRTKEHEHTEGKAETGE